MNHRAVVIGVGNETCGDDAAGLLVVRRVKARGIAEVSCLEAPADPLSLLDAWDGVPLVVVVDAVCSGAKPGSVVRLDAGAGPLPAALRPFSSHGFGIVEVIELARALGRLPPRVLVYGIEGAGFEPGDVVCDAVSAAVECVAGQVVVDCAG